MTQQRKKIAVIGGGMCSMTAVYEITKTPDWRQKYDIDIYQLGWRIGGKGASGRNAEVAERIEEHGLHIWFGFYTNAFNLIKDCYANLGPTTSPLKTFDDAFKPQSFIPLGEHIDGQWETWNLDFPTNSLEPGGEDEFLPLWAYIEMILEVILRNITNQKEDSIITKVILKPLVDLMSKALKTAKDAKENIGNSQHESHSELLKLIDEVGRCLKNILGDLLSRNATTRHLFIIVDLGLTSIRGILADDLINRGLDAVNDEEFMHWLRRHGAADLTINSTLITALYDVGFAYENGDLTKRNYEAGSAIRIIIRLGLTYKGAFMWKMQAGMGDTIFTPMYEILNRYTPSEEEGGITFKFFHKVKNLGLSEDKKNISTILVEEQATLKNPEAGYDPFVVVKDLPCWPSTPNYDQLVQGDELQAQNINLESMWSPWQGTDKTLRQGEDYDSVILGVPIASLPHMCPELIDANPQWVTMLENVKTTQTQAYQIWLNKSLEELGWENPSPVMTSYVEPVDTWADMPQLIVREDFPPAYEPKDIGYFCGVLQDASVIPPFSVHSFPATQALRVKESLTKFVNEDAGFLWPNATQPDNPDGLDYDTMVDMENREGEERINAQFWRANIDPHERYTLTTVNSSIHRLKTDETGFDNLYITGDWIQNSFNYGCIEACVMSGMMTARAITGYQFNIVGEDAWA